MSFIYFYLFDNLFASRNITYKNAIQMTLKVGYSQKGLLCNNNNF